MKPEYLEESVANLQAQVDVLEVSLMGLVSALRISDQKAADHALASIARYADALERPPRDARSARAALFARKMLGDLRALGL